MTRKKFIALYESRIKGIKLDDRYILEQLLVQDEKTFYFVLMYFFLTDRDLNQLIRWSPILSIAVTLFCHSANRQDVTEYFSKYLDITEIPHQTEKIVSELNQITE